MMIEPFFQTAQSRAFGNRVNWHEYQGRIRVQTYTVKGMQWITLSKDDFVRQFRI